MTSELPNDIPDRYPPIEDPEVLDLIERLELDATRPLPAGLVDRIHAASVAMLPLPAPMRAPSGTPRHLDDGRRSTYEVAMESSGDRRWSFVNATRRWAPRLAMAASLGIALVIASPIVRVLHQADHASSVDVVMLQTLLAQNASPVEPMLVALLCEDGGSCWLDGAPEGRELVHEVGFEAGPVLSARGASFDDLAAEFGRIVGHDAQTTSGGRR